MITQAMDMLISHRYKDAIAISKRFPFDETLGIYQPPQFVDIKKYFELLEAALSLDNTDLVFNLEEILIKYLEEGLFKL